MKPIEKKYAEWYLKFSKAKQEMREFGIPLPDDIDTLPDETQLALILDILRQMRRPH